MFKPETLEQSHQTLINKEDLVYKVAEKMIEEGKTALRVLCDMMQEKRKDTIFNISGSTFTTGNSNPFAYILGRTLKPFFGETVPLIMGTAYHKALEVYTKAVIKNKDAMPTKEIQKAVEKSIQDSYKYLSDTDKREKSTADIVGDTLTMVNSYLLNKPKDTPIGSEEFLKLEVPEEMIEHKENALRILFTGASDIVYKRGGDIILSDNKSSAKPIKGPLPPKADLLIMSEIEIAEISKEISATAKRNTKATGLKGKSELLAQELEVLFGEIETAKESEKSTKAIQGRIEKKEEKIITYGEEIQSLTDEGISIELLEKKRAETKMLLPPLYDRWEAEKIESDLFKAKEQHGQQLAFYALLQMILFGRKITHLRIENMVKTEQPYLQIFEWELTDYEMQKAEEQIRVFVKRLEMFIEGVDPLVLFPVDNMSWIGTEANLLIREAEIAADALRV